MPGVASISDISLETAVEPGTAIAAADTPSSTAACSERTGAASSNLHKRGLSNNDVHSPAESNTSQQPSKDSAPEDGRYKKRKTGPSSRGVANLTPEQLAKKRANDREAQRAIRERTKNQIENLENKIKELTSQQPYVELQAVIRAKEAVEAELADLKGRMASIMSLIQPILTAHPNENAYASPVPTVLPVQPGNPPSIQSGTHAATPPSTASPTSGEWHQAGVHSAGSSTQTSPNFNQVQIISQQRQNSLHALDFGVGEQLKLDFLLDSSSADRINRMQTGVNGAQDSPSFNHLPMKHDWNMVSLSSPRPGSLAQTQSFPQQQQQQHHHHHPPPTRHEYGSESQHTWRDYSIPIKNCAPTCPLDNLLLDFLHERRQRAAEGVPTQEIVGPRYPSVSSLLNPAQSQYSHPLSKVFTDILATFPGICTLPERVAVLYAMFLLMRWQISPTRETFERLPEWLRPTPMQTTRSHSAWLDSCPFPRMRDKMILMNNLMVGPEGHGTVPFENFFIPFTTTLSVNWPYEATDVLLESPDGNELLINPVFERHMRRLENWTLGDAFHAAFPSLEGTYNLKKGDKDTRR
ncbi:hypothetical protein BX600DRAFT_430782 [Xylariales sp. PMI_506]|nr:hypothetical protein BX600DRAFT_430782 [Xylariales sp. PMI_506]